MIGAIVERLLGHRCYACGRRTHDAVRHYLACAANGAHQ